MEPSIRKQLSRLMRDKKLSQSALSRATGVPQPTINRILSQTTVDLRRDSVVRIAKYLDVTPESLYTSGADKGSDMASAVDPTGADKGDAPHRLKQCIGKTGEHKTKLVGPPFVARGSVSK